MPPTIRRLLDRLRTRERLLAVSWAGARFLALFAALVVLACLLDWWIDRYRDTPEGLRFALRWGQVVLWVLLPSLWAILNLRRVSDDAAALAIEEKTPSLGHRLISAVQLNRPGAQVAGMSPALIAAVTNQAEEQAAAVDPTQVSDGRRFRWAGMLFGSLGIVLGFLFFLASPRTSQALLSRLMGGDDEIPRSVRFAANPPKVWPSAEEGVLRLAVTGSPSETHVGELRVIPESGPAFSVELRHDSGETWAAKVPPMDEPFTYKAWLGDGRLRQPGEVSYSPRPVVRSLQASVLLPTKQLGQRPNGQPYEEPQRGGDVDYRLPESAARLTVTTQVPIVWGVVRVQGGRERLVPLTISTAGTDATASIDLRPEDRGYDVLVRDRHSFENHDPPRRAIRRLPLEPPEVALLPETFYKEGDAGPPEDREVEGIPVLLSERFALAYEAKARYGLARAQLRYRVIPKTARVDEDSGNLDLDAFVPLPLGRPRGAKGPPSAQLREEFSTRPAGSPDAPPDTEGGGRYDFLTTGIPDGKGGLLDLKEGDRIQFYVEAFGKADPDGVPGRSAVREKEVVDVKAYLAWLQKKEDLKERTRHLEEQQRAARPGLP
ncbi:MAG: hypothetical protein U0797_16025 [Gemmataceae bacterium]